MRSKFQVGDKIQCVGAPHLVWLVKEVRLETYTLAPPDDGAWVEMSREEVDRTYAKGAREYDRQFNEYLRKSDDPPDPRFDKDGFPTRQFFIEEDERNS